MSKALDARNIMPKHLNINPWQGKPTDVAYKDPFSDTTYRTRRKVLIVSSLILLNHFFPIDLEKTYILGLHFLEGHVPKLTGLLGIILIYFTTMLAIYTFQEIKSWLAQANELAFVSYRQNLHNIYAHHQGIDGQIKYSVSQLELHNESISELKTLLTGDNSETESIKNKLNGMEVYKESFKNLYTNLEINNKKFGDEIEKAFKYLRKTESEYKTSMFTQWVKVGFLETVLPFSISFLSICLAFSGILQVLKVILKSI